MVTSGGSAYVWWFGVMMRPPSRGMFSTPWNSRPNQARAAARMPGRKRSRIGVRSTTSSVQKKKGPGSLPAPPGIALAMVLVVVLVAATDLDRLQLPAVPLDAVLAADAGLNL